MPAKLYKVGSMEDSTPSTNAIFSQLRILVVDDNPVDREMVRIHLQSLGFENLQEAQSGSEGMFKVENAAKIGKPFHLVVSDWRMPEKDGMALLKFLKSEKTYRNTRIVMVTSVNEATLIKNAIYEGVDEFILKPIHPATLAQKLEKLLKIKP
jgi:two-component system chemotaxis response regulator CheY